MLRQEHEKLSDYQIWDLKQSLYGKTNSTRAMAICRVSVRLSIRPFGFRGLDVFRSQLAPLPTNEPRA